MSTQGIRHSTKMININYRMEKVPVDGFGSAPQVIIPIVSMILLQVLYQFSETLVVLDNI